MHLNGPGFHRTVIVAVCSHDRIPTQDHYEMDLAAMFRVDCGRTVCETPENSRDLSYKACSAQVMRRSNPRRPAIVSAYGIDRVATHHGRPMDIAAIFRDDHFRVVSPRPSIFPRDSSETARGKKKVSRNRTLSARKARQNASSRWSKYPENGTNSSQNGHNGHPLAQSRSGPSGSFPRAESCIPPGCSLLPARL
jgi:hypothetical protein